MNPSAFFFTARANQGGIINQSRATQTVLGNPTDGLQVPNGQTLLLLGGNVTVDDGRLIARGGRVEIGAVAGSGSVGLNANGSLSVPDGMQRADVVFTNRVFTTGNRSGIDVRLGNGGDIGITAGNIGVFGGSQLRAGIAARLGVRSNITTNASGRATGGNITIDTGVMAGLENSDITANAFEGQGGIIYIRAQGIFGLVQRDLEELRTLLGTNKPNELDLARLPSSDITAISQTDPSLRGQVTINNPDVDPSLGLVALPAELVDATGLIAQGCPAGVRRGESKFIATGRGGLPLSPNEPLRGRAVITGWVDLPPQATQRVTDKLSTTSVTKSTNQILEAQGWVVDANGDVILVAQSPQSFSISSPISCSQ